MKEFKDNLRDLRKKYGLSRQRLSKMTGISRTSLAGYEMGTSSPTLPKVCALADYFGVSLDALAGYGEIKETDIRKIFIALTKIYRIVNRMERNQ